VRVSSVALISLLSACVAGDPLGSSEQPLLGLLGGGNDGYQKQGTRMQGTRMQGTRMQGTRMQGTRMQGVSLEGSALVVQALVQPAYDASLAACASPTSGEDRACGWDLGGIGTCLPGRPITVSTAGCGGDSIVRVCRDRAACGPRSPSEIVARDDGAGGACAAASFQCPGSGSYTVLVGNQDSADPSVIKPVASEGSFPLTYTQKGAALAGSTMTAVDSDGDSFEILIADAEPDPGDSEILLYTLLYRDALTGSWENVCDADSDGVARALPLSGVWDATGARQDGAGNFTVACTSGVLAKCARWGYKPWTSVNGVSLAPYHQTCTRMARADYCGNGTPHTADGTLIDMYDDRGVQTRSSGDLMVYEASWTPDGAYCVGKGRWDLDGPLMLAECGLRLQLPSLTDLLAGCVVKLTNQSRASIKISNDSYLELSVLSAILP
jgi:hypothetical protein